MSKDMTPREKEAYTLGWEMGQLEERIAMIDYLTDFTGYQYMNFFTPELFIKVLKGGEHRE